MSDIFLRKLTKRGGCHHGHGRRKEEENLPYSAGGKGKKIQKRRGGDSWLKILPPQPTEG